VAEAENKEESAEKRLDELSHYNKLYLTMIMRYKELIEEQENLYVAELPKLVTPEDPAVLALANSFKAKINEYNSDSDFFKAAKAAHAYVKEEIATVTLPVQFWLMPSETISAGAGDLLDKATLLCSIFIALGNITSKIIIATKDSERKVGVYCESANTTTVNTNANANARIVYFDIENGVSEYASKEELLQSLGIGNDNISAYEFNDKMYNDLA